MTTIMKQMAGTQHTCLPPLKLPLPLLVLSAAPCSRCLTLHKHSLPNANCTVTAACAQLKRVIVSPFLNYSTAVEA